MIEVNDLHKKFGKVKVLGAEESCRCLCVNLSKWYCFWRCTSFS